jgi:hypothetical protein
MENSGEKARSESLVRSGMSRNGKIHLRDPGNSPADSKYPSSVHVARNVQQQVDESRWKVVAGDEHGHGADQGDIVRRNVAGQIDGSSGNVSLVMYGTRRT